MTPPATRPETAPRDPAGARLRLGPPQVVFPTTSGMHVALCASERDGLVIAKYPRPGAGPMTARALAEQARQLRVLRQYCPQAPFPVLLEAVPGRIVLRYVPGTTLRDSRGGLTQARRRELLTAAATTLLDLAGRGADGPAATRAPSGAGFLETELRRRLRRLDAAMAELPRGAELRAALIRCDGGALLRELGRADDSGELRRIGAALAPARLGLGIHGDLTPQNIIYDPAAGQDLTFIDPRGLVRWHDGLPWWDPVFDLAAAVVFDGAVDAIAAADAPQLGDPGFPAALAAELDGTRAVLAAGCAADVRAAAWLARDPRWLGRLGVAILARLLGNVAVQAEHGGPDGVQRAAAVYAVSARWFGSLSLSAECPPQTGSAR